MIKLGLKGRKWEIFCSAIDLFAIKGFEGTSMNDIAEANGIQSASLYNHFSSKDNILRLIFCFYEANVLDTAPVLSEALKKIPKLHPNEVLLSITQVFSPELQPLMDKIFLIAIGRSYQDADAYKLIWNHYFEHTRRHISTILESMITMEIIEPLDIDVIVNLYAGYSFFASFRNQPQNPITFDQWVGGLDLVFSTIKLKSKDSVRAAE